MIKKISILLLLACSSLLASSKAVVFDFGGVMTVKPSREGVVKLICDTLHLSLEDFETLNQERKIAARNGIAESEFWTSYAVDKKIDLPANWEQDLQVAIKNAIGINPSMYTIVWKLKEKAIPVGLLTNTDKSLSKLIGSLGLFAPFTPCILSYEMGVRKPDPRIFQIVLDKLGLAAGEVVYIDDKEENIAAAQGLGFDAILFFSEEQIKKEFIKRGLLVSDDFS